MNNYYIYLIVHIIITMTSQLNIPSLFSTNKAQKGQNFDSRMRIFSSVGKDIIPVIKTEKKRGVMFIYNFWIGTGNNAELVKRILQTRQNWIEGTENDRCHFRWAQTQRPFKYDIMSSGYTKQMVNHFEFHNEISDKARLVRNLNQYCESTRQNMFNFTPPTFIIDFSDMFCDKFLNDFLVYYAKYYPKSTNTAQINRMRMDYLYYLKNLINGTGQKQKPFSNKYCVCHMLQTFLDKTNNNYLWLLKPTFLNRGRGVRVFSELSTLKEYVKEYMTGYTEKLPSVKKDQKNLSQSFIKTDAFVVQKYVQRPLVINKRKFDIRTWALVDQEYNIYFFKQGYVRMSSQDFDLSEKNINNAFIHLTNNAIQKHNENYCKFESGNQLSFTYLQKYIKQNYRQTIQQLDCGGALNKTDIFFQKFITGKMKEIARKSLNSVKKKINPYDRKYCMQIFGYDFIIDEKLNIWLIEVNTNPCIQQSSDLLKQLIPRMLNDAFKLTIDVFFPKWNYTNDTYNTAKLKIIETRVPVRKNSDMKFRVTGYEDDKNMWENIGNINPNLTLSKRRRIF